MLTMRGVQVLSNLSQQGSLAQMPGASSHPPGAPHLAHMGVMTGHLSHSMGPPPTMLPPGGASMHMMPPTTMHQHMPHMHAPQSMRAQPVRMHGAPPQSMAATQAYPMQQMSMMDDPLMTTLH
jgi:hypothetical protein